METSVLYGLKQKQLCFVLRENVNTDPDLQLRLRGHLNTVTGDFEYTGSLQKYFRSGPPVKDQGTQPLRIGAGVGISSSTGDEPYLTATAKKQIALTEGTDTLLSAKAVVSYEPRSGKVGIMDNNAHMTHVSPGVSSLPCALNAPSACPAGPAELAVPPPVPHLMLHCNRHRQHPSDSMICTLQDCSW
jgi:hypothetical protein